MGLRFIHGWEPGATCGCVLLYDSTHEVVFGKPLGSLGEGEAFLKWARGQDVSDLRRLPAGDVVDLQDKWVAAGKPCYDPETDDVVLDDGDDG